MPSPLSARFLTRLCRLLACGVAEHAHFATSFEGYRTALAEHGTRATLQGILDATAI
jgi:hypothetical protein